MTTLNRRDLLKKALPLAICAVAPRRAAAARLPSYAKDFPDMLVSHLAKEMDALAEAWDQERARIQTPAQIEDRNRFVRQKCVEMLHRFPEKTLLNPVVVNVLRRDGYWIESVMFQSRPNFWVPASLYIPSAGRGPFPGIISPCGHAANGRLYPAYQFMYMNLVKSGFVVLAYDPVGQGERRQYWNPQTNTDELGGPVTWEHSFPGQLLLLIGEDLTHYRVWDGIRAIDYLLTRPEVDLERIGCTGQSGGGTFTLFISALDERVKCAAMHQGGSRHRWPLRIRPETRLSTGDTEQHMFPSAIYGIDLCDLHVAIAPRPLLTSIEQYSPDFDETAEHVRMRYRQLGAPEKFATEEATDPHGMTVKLRLATTNWFCRWFYNRKGPDTEPEFELERPQDLYCTANGSVRYSQQGDTIFSLILKKQGSLPPKKKAPRTVLDLEGYRQEMDREIRKLLRLPRTNHPLGAREILSTPRKRYRIEKLEFLSEPGIYIPTWVFLLEGTKPAGLAILFVSDGGIAREGMEFGLLEKLTRKGNVVVAVDVRGIGSTKPAHPEDYSRSEFGHVDDGENVLSYLAWEMNESLFGMRVYDLLRSVQYVLSRPDVDRAGVRVIGKGMGALWTLFAAALEPRIQSAVCEGGLLSYRSLIQVDRYLHGANVFLTDVLKHFDLPHVAAAVADRRLALLGPLDAMKKPVNLQAARQEYRFTLETYSSLDKANRFRIVAGESNLDASEQYLGLLDA